jgi:Zn finger protein HypA/HybF involved in hydrogenase expression
MKTQNLNISGLNKSRSCDNFIKKANKKHGSYVYNKIDYINSKTKVEIICPEHGSFWQTPAAHVFGQGCPKCGKIKSVMSRSKTNNAFIEELKTKFPEYDYTKVNYICSKTKITIVCPIHGKFLAVPNNFLSGHLCPLCGYKRTSDKLKLPVEEKSAKCKKLHPEYDYTKTDFSKDPIIVSCPIHGEFNQSLHNHLYLKSGCRQCAGNIKLTPGEIILKMSEKHNKVYDYAYVDYVNRDTKIKIKCKTHGYFWQTPRNHLQGQGCPKCATRGFNLDKEAILYYLYDPEEELYKIGITNKDTSSRFGAGFIKERGIRILMEEVYQNGKQALLAEQEILQAFESARTTNPTWPETLGGKTEFFNRNILEL